MNSEIIKYLQLFYFPPVKLTRNLEDVPIFTITRYNWFLV